MKVKVKGYQSVINETSIEVEGLTVITGESNIGKSAYIRAILGALQNQKGNWFISKGAEELAVTIENEGHSITWLKTEKTSAYEVDGSSHRKAGRSTPVEEIAKLGFFEVRAQDRQYFPQIHKQFAPPFIIAESSPVAAAELLAASKEGQKLAKAVKLAQRDQANKSSEILVREESLEGLNLILKETAKYEKKIKEGAERILENEQKLNLLNTRKEVLQSLKGSFERLEKKLKAIERCPQRELSKIPDPGKLTILKSLYLRYSEALRKEKAIEVAAKLPYPSEVPQQKDITIQKFKKLRDTYKSLENRLKALQKVENKVPDMQSWIQVASRIGKLRFLKKDYEQRLVELGELEEQLQHNHQERENLEQEISETLKALGKCPTCGQETQEPHVHRNGPRRVYAEA